MAHISVNQYLQLINEALLSGDGVAAADYLSCKDPHIASPRLQMERPDMAVQKVIDPPWDDVISCHIKCIYFINNHDFIEAYKHQYSLVQKILQTQKEENWALPIMYTCCLDLRILAGNADTQLIKKGKSKPGQMLERAADLIMGFFRVCASDNRSSQEDSKRWGMLYLVNQLFKIYFKINKLHLCKPLIRAIDSSNLKDMFKISQLVTYKYYVGQKAMFDSDFVHAEEYLSFAFLRCHKKCVKNKQLILMYLIPVKMLLGHMPSLKLLEKYELMQFAELAQAVKHPVPESDHQELQLHKICFQKEGNLLKLNASLVKHENFFIRWGIYLILERLKIITYRNLFKKVHLLLKTYQIPVDAFLTALKFMKVEDIDHDEVLCILANLIYEGKIKGYISYQHQKLVVSKQNAFPALSSIS